MSTNPLINNAMGMTDDLIGGSSLMWRYHHQVSHHIHCNDDALDEDVLNAFPFLRFDPRLPGFAMPDVGPFRPAAGIMIM